MPSSLTEKQILRNAVLAKRDALTPDFRDKAARTIAENYADDLNIQSGQVVSGFWPIRSEIDPRPVLNMFRERGALICLPVILNKTQICFRFWQEDQALVPCGFGTMAPDQTAPTLRPDVMLMPLAGFDKSGHRLGYGAGYYDRYISNLHNQGHFPELIGFAFSCQELPSVPDEQHDVPLEKIVTENGLRFF
ncbi:5-formyltetrahydrofolate cyclo-ligase [Paenochrobactrum gallinarii]|uniref:5-formyltetrahydrofolate cyclo-ligase n=1 Tax=Paenochrobactrum gallinarii TaxID=643673 RepID=A0A841LT77_9HYPH|nr:5-formyltetrahydrofolate cyclo-ligase [Paenochrobactrum gallinarii]